MPAQDDRSAGGASLGKPPPGHYYTLDALAKGLASEGLSRGQALRMLGSALAGGALAVFIPGVAWGQEGGPVNHGPNRPGNHGPNGPVNGGRTGGGVNQGRPPRHSCAGHRSEERRVGT